MSAQALADKSLFLCLHLKDELWNVCQEIKRSLKYSRMGPESIIEDLAAILEQYILDARREVVSISKLVFGHNPNQDTSIRFTAKEFAQKLIYQDSATRIPEIASLYRTGSIRVPFGRRV